MHTTRSMMIPAGMWREAQKVPAPTSTVRTAIPRSQAAPTNIPAIAIRHRTAAFRRTGRHPLRVSQSGIQRPLMISQSRIQCPLMMNQVRIQRSLKLRSLPRAAMYAAWKAAVSSRSWTASMNIMRSVGMPRLWKDSPAPMSALCAA